MYLYRVADSLMVAQLGIEALAGIAIGVAYATAHEMLIWPVALGVQAVVSRRVGRRQARLTEERQAEAPTPAIPPAAATDAIAEVLPQGLWAGLLAGTIACVIAALAPVLVPLITTAAAAPEAIDYVAISMWGLPVMGLASGLRGYVAGNGHTRAVMVAVVVSNLVNVALNWIFIFGNLGAPALGVRGAAVGTVLSHLTALLLYVGYHRLVVAPRGEYRRAVPGRPDRKLVTTILRIGLPSAIQNATAMVIILLFQGMMGTLGTIQVAVTHVLFSTFRINKALVGGFANGASILVGNALGADDPPSARAVIRTQLVLGAVVGGVLLVVVVAAAPAIASLFALEEEARRLAALGFRVLAPFYFLEITGYSLEIIFSHNGWGRYVLMSEVVTNVAGILGVTMLLVLVLQVDLPWAWAGFALYQVGHAAILFGGLRHGGWARVAVD